eukprot:CAMPEP_0171698422 /NCGR_PEP_ID=MMETSP0991-20121206/9350_1 /TAXON_ID=483369 /ORGANISM="non described non described, Strain CCMP2098" /LENGTH=128 /DNA_ID=CAMNT_0012287289 /DNA_START=1 /DNA_END=386 /DNA_ORIENTATION=+
MAAADDNPFRVHAQDQKYLRDQQDSAVAERKDQLLNSAAAARPSEMRWTPEDDRVGVAGIGPDVPVRNFNNPVLPKPTWFADRDYKALHLLQGSFYYFQVQTTPLPRVRSRVLQRVHAAPQDVPATAL